jgi:membrane-associated phospholipid phosphatase
MHDVVIIVAKYFIILPPLVLAYVWLRLGRADKKQAVILGVIAAALTGILAILGSKLINDPRPFVAGHFTPYFAHGNDNGFPSDHTLFAGLVACITYVYSKRFGYVTFALALLIGLSRVIAGVHHLIDIVAALLMAVAATALSKLLVRRFITKT